MKKAVLIILLVRSFVVPAQVRVTVTAGGNLSTIVFKDEGRKSAGSFIPRVRFGTLIRFPLDQNWFLTTGPYYSGKGCRYGITLPAGKRDSITIHLNYIRMAGKNPVSFFRRRRKRF